MNALVWGLGGLLVLLCTLLAAMVALMTVLIFVSRLRTRRPLYWYGPPRPTTSTPDPKGYAKRTIEAALAQGFTLVGWCDDLNEPPAPIAYAILVAPERTTLAVVCIGKAGKMDLDVTWLQTFAADQRHIWVSCDHSAGAEVSPARHTIRLFTHSDFAELLAKHRAWTAPRAGDRALVFPPGAELAEVKRLALDGTDRMVREGHARYTDPARTHWTYTARGALLSTLKTMRLLVWQMWFGRRRPRH